MNTKGVRIMKIAIIGDIHANLPALRAVIEAIHTHQVDAIISTGDIVGYLPYPNEVIDLLRYHHVLVVRGNHDARFQDEPLACQEELDDRSQQASASFIWTNHQLTNVNRQYLSNLPTEMSLQFGAKSLRIVHGSHRRNNEYLYPDEHQLQAVAEEIFETIFVSGHTHEAYVCEVKGKTFVNPGSVGKPKIPGAKASYAVITIEHEKVQVELQTVNYDSTQLCQKIVAIPGIDSKLQQLFTNAE